MSKTPFQIRKLIFSTSKLNGNEKNNLNKDKNLYKNIFSSKEILELIKGSKYNRNKELFE